MRCFKLTLFLLLLVLQVTNAFGITLAKLISQYPNMNYFTPKTYMVDGKTIAIPYPIQKLVDPNTGNVIYTALELGGVGKDAVVYFHKKLDLNEQLPDSVSVCDFAMKEGRITENEAEITTAVNPEGTVYILQKGTGKEFGFVMPIKPGKNVFYYLRESLGENEYEYGKPNVEADAFIAHIARLYLQAHRDMYIGSAQYNGVRFAHGDSHLGNMIYDPKEDSLTSVDFAYSKVKPEIDPDKLDNMDKGIVFSQIEYLKKKVYDPKLKKTLDEVVKNMKRGRLNLPQAIEELKQIEEIATFNAERTHNVGIIPESKDYPPIFSEKEARTQGFFTILREMWEKFLNWKSNIWSGGNEAAPPDTDFHVDKLI